MKPEPLLAPLAAAALAAMTSAPVPAQRGGVLRAGEPLPHLELPTIDGERTIDLADFVASAGGAGKKVLLIQFASW